ncbi:copper amine oxidase [Kalaharituber pfeilii]|nr:copper amine oxidase [Kalaharituber pfeilii]
MPRRQIKAPRKNLWNTLPNDEVSSLIKWLYDPRNGLNLTHHNEATHWDNFIGVTEIIHPNKTDAVAYLDGSGPHPFRYARIVIFHGASEEPYLHEIMVGPLPVSAKTSWKNYDYPYNKGNSVTPWYRADDRQRIRDLYYPVTAELADITQDLLGTAARGLVNDTAALMTIDPLWQENERIFQWMEFVGLPNNGYTAETLLPQGLYLKFDITGRDPSGWALKAILYNGIMYNSISEFRRAYEQPGFTKLNKHTQGDWLATKRQGKPFLLDELPPPLPQQAKGPRYLLDRKEKYLKWMDFSFYLGFSRDLGLSLHDIRYKGRRIIFELGLQEALSHYAGNNPMEGTTSYLDSYYGLGSFTYTLIPGYDCPEFATYLDSWVHENGNTAHQRNSICVFEQDAGYLMQRHTATEWYGYENHRPRYATATKNTVFIVRSVASVDNYDYTFDYTFYIDGTIEIKVRASGYIQGAFYANNSDYGYQIHDALSGSFHTHVLTFKADLDILGEKNTLEKVAMIPTTEKYPWSAAPRNTMKLVRSSIGNESQGRINWPMNGAEMYVVLNKDERNKYGEYPGYRIFPASGTPTHLIVQDSPSLQNAAEFCKYHLYVTKRKDTEPRCAAAANNLELSDPLVNFSKFFDEESLLQEDIVLWFNLGMHHIAHTGDLPNTVSSTAQGSIMISPHNYLEMDPSRQTRQMIEILFAPGVNNASVIDAHSTLMTRGHMLGRGIVELFLVDSCEGVPGSNAAWVFTCHRQRFGIGGIACQFA